MNYKYIYDNSNFYFKTLGVIISMADLILTSNFQDIQNDHPKSSKLKSHRNSRDLSKILNFESRD